LKNKEKKISVTETYHGLLHDKPLYSFLLKNETIEIVITNFGCIVLSVNTPDKNGNNKNILAGFKTPDEYKYNKYYFGCVIGRYANRIAKGTFMINGQTYHLKLNDGVNSLHGGEEGFHNKVWEVKNIINGETQVGIEFEYISKDGEEDFPGNLLIKVTYLLNDKNELIIQYKAVTDKATPVSLTNHSYFNLTGFENNNIHDHLLQINAGEYTEKNANNQPTGDILKVNDSVFDFRLPQKIGANIFKEELKIDKGYDHNFVLKHHHSDELLHAATLSDEVTGRELKVFTTAPGLQVYTANFFDGSVTGRQNKIYNQHCCVALETQAFPDSPNHSNFPNTILNPGEEYHSTTIYSFGLINQ